MRRMFLMLGAIAVIAGCDKSGGDAAGCGPGDYKNDAMRFCLALPADMEAKADGKPDTTPTGPRQGFSTKYGFFNVEAGNGVVADSEESWTDFGKLAGYKIRERKDLPKGKGKYAVIEHEGSVRIEAVVPNPSGKGVLKCSDSFDTKVADLEKRLQICKSLATF